MNYNDIDDVIDGLNNIVNINSVGNNLELPSPIIFYGVPKRNGLSPIKIASRIISRKSEAGLNSGLLNSGEISPDEIMERIRVEEIIKAIQEEAIITISIEPGITLNGTGTSVSGGPVTIVGSTINFGKGYGIIQ